MTEPVWTGKGAYTLPGFKDLSGALATRLPSRLKRARALVRAASKGQPSSRHP